MEHVPTIDDARQIMVAFAAQTGLSNSERPPRRYLWTDAFAVCNFLTLYRRTGDGAFRQLALDLVDQVHSVLGRHREDDPRRGWISGLDDEMGARHPTAGGLRIGKSLRERGPGEPFDERAEWDRDGQYFHYLTKWMHALERVGAVTRDPAYGRWALDLAKAAHAAFAYTSGTGAATRMYWKMSIDLSRPLVSSMGHHDPLDGLITYSELRRHGRLHPDGAPAPELGTEIAQMAALCTGRDFATDDPLGIGGLLFDAYRAVRMTADGDFDAPALPEALLLSAATGLEGYIRRNPMDGPVPYRLAFRELGLSIGLRAVEWMSDVIARDPGLSGGAVAHIAGKLAGYVPLGREIESFWSDAGRQQSASWRAHSDINMVMLATSIAPDEFLSL